jgi:hypothetical protein
MSIIWSAEIRMLKIHPRCWTRYLVFSWNLCDKLCQQEVMFFSTGFLNSRWFHRANFKSKYSVFQTVFIKWKTVYCKLAADHSEILNSSVGRTKTFEKPVTLWLVNWQEIWNVHNRRQIECSFQYLLLYPFTSPEPQSHKIYLQNPRRWWLLHYDLLESDLRGKIMNI